MMDGGAINSRSEKLCAPTETMAAVIDALGGRRVWNGQVRGLFGLIRRRFTIHSTGAVEAGALLFDERLVFDDGAVENRHWRIEEGDGGLVISAQGVDVVAPGRIRRGVLVFVYCIKFGGFRFLYRDEFRLRPDGEVRNLGSARFKGVPVMRISAVSRAAN